MHQPLVTRAKVPQRNGHCEKRVPGTGILRGDDRRDLPGCEDQRGPDDLWREDGAETPEYMKTEIDHGKTFGMREKIMRR